MPQLPGEKYPHLEIRDIYALMITSGEVPPGGQLPPIREMAERYGVSPETVQKAVRLLAAEGLVTTHGRGGTRVAVTVTRPRLLLGPQQRLGYTRPVSGERTEVISAGMVDAAGPWAYIAAVLYPEIEEVSRHQITPVYLRRQVTYGHGAKPRLIESSWTSPRWAAQIPALASETVPVMPLGGVAWAISQHTGWPIIQPGTHGFEARHPHTGDDWEIPRLGVGRRGALLAAVCRWDALTPLPGGGQKRVILEYVEYCARMEQVIEIS